MNHSIKYLFFILSLSVFGLNAEPGWVFCLESKKRLSNPFNHQHQRILPSNIGCYYVPEGDEITDEIAELARGLRMILLQFIIMSVTKSIMSLITDTKGAANADRKKW